MLRKSKVLSTILMDDFFELHPELRESNIEFRIDEKNEKEIKDFLTETDKNDKYVRRKKFNRILYTMLQGRYDKELYDKEEVSEKAKNVTSMKFKGKQNFRIACKEIECKNKTIIMVVHFHKKTQKNSKKEVTLYETVGGYKYEC